MCEEQYRTYARQTANKALLVVLVPLQHKRESCKRAGSITSLVSTADTKTGPYYSNHPALTSN